MAGALPFENGVVLSRLFSQLIVLPDEEFVHHLCRLQLITELLILMLQCLDASFPDLNCCSASRSSFQLDLVRQWLLAFVAICLHIIFLHLHLVLLFRRRSPALVALRLRNHLLFFLLLRQWLLAFCRMCYSPPPLPLSQPVVARRCHMCCSPPPHPCSFPFSCLRQSLPASVALGVQDRLLVILLQLLPMLALFLLHLRLRRSFPAFVDCRKERVFGLLALKLFVCLRHS